MPFLSGRVRENAPLDQYRGADRLPAGASSSRTNTHQTTKLRQGTLLALARFDLVEPSRQGMRSPGVKSRTIAASPASPSTDLERGENLLAMAENRRGQSPYNAIKDSSRASNAAKRHRAKTDNPRHPNGAPAIPHNHRTRSTHWTQAARRPGHERLRMLTDGKGLSRLRRPARSNATNHTDRRIDLFDLLLEGMLAITGWEVAAQSQTFFPSGGRGDKAHKELPAL